MIDAPFAPLLDFIGHLGHNGDAGLHQTHIDVYFYHRLSGDRISLVFPHSLNTLGALTHSCSLSSFSLRLPIFILVEFFQVR